jgi:dTDP-4-dehydrorhamnose reductase
MLSTEHSPTLVTGADGQLGAALVDRLQGAARVVGIDKRQLDVGDAESVRRFVCGLGPRLILNCAAFNDVDGAEADPLEALRINSAAVWTLGSLAREVGALFVHYSSDFVFDGSQEAPYSEEDVARPLSVYGMSKLLGEHCAAAAPRHYILRLSSLFGGHTRRTFVDHIISLGVSGQRVTAFVDRTVSPSFVPDVVEATLALVTHKAPHGIYHCGSGGSTNWCELAAHILSKLGRADLLEPMPFEDRAGHAIRPRHCALSGAKLTSLGIQVSTWMDTVDHYVTIRLREEGVA